MEREGSSERTKIAAGKTASKKKYARTAAPSSTRSSWISRHKSPAKSVNRR